MTDKEKLLAKIHAKQDVHKHEIHVIYVNGNPVKFCACLQFVESRDPKDAALLNLNARYTNGKRLRP